MPKTVLLITRVAQGGMKYHLQLLTKRLNGHQWKVMVAGPLADSSDAQIKKPDLPIPIYDGISLRKDWQAVSTLRRFLQENRVDLLHAHGWKAAAVAELARLGLPRIPLLVTLHNALPPQVRGLKHWILKQAGTATIKHADHTIVVSPALRDLALQLYPPAVSKLQLIPNGIDVQALHNASLAARSNKVEVLRKLGLTAAPELVVGTVCRLIREKGVFELVEAFEQVAAVVQNAALIIIGDGPARNELLAAISTVQAKTKIHCLGWVDDAATLMGVFDVFALPSWSEGMPISVMEAMAAGVPIVACEVGGVPNLVADGVTGILVPPKHPRKLASALVELLTNPEKRDQLGRAAYQSVLARFDQDEMLRQTAALYQLLVNNQPQFGS